MDGKTKGLIVGDTFVIDESEIVAVERGKECDVYLRAGCVIFIPDVEGKVFERCKAVLKKRAKDAEPFKLSPWMRQRIKDYGAATGNLVPSRYPAGTNGHDKQILSAAEYAKVVSPTTDDWRNRIYVGARTALSDGRMTDYWLRWTSPEDHCYYWLSPEKNVWVGEPHQIGMPAWPGEVSAYKALQNAPTPPGWKRPTRGLSKVGDRDAIRSIAGPPGFELTGEVRFPLKNEWYFHLGQAFTAFKDFCVNEYPILRRKPRNDAEYDPHDVPAPIAKADSSGFMRDLDEAAQKAGL
jgi:hypothetical protein